MFLAHLRRFVQQHVERAVFLITFLDEVQLLTILN